MEWEDVDWINLARDRVKWWAIVSTGNEPSASTEDAEFLDCVSDYKPRKHLLHGMSCKFIYTAETGYVISYVENLTEGKSGVSMFEFPTGV
jgi:hypothetical protein